MNQMQELPDIFPEEEEWEWEWYDEEEEEENRFHDQENILPVLHI